MNNLTVIRGYISVSAVIKGGKREMKRIVFDTERYNKIMQSKYHYNEKKQYATLKNSGVPVEYFSAEEFLHFTDGDTAGGIAAEVGERIFCTPEKLLCNKKAYILVLDGIEDPYNFGYVLRTVYAAGADGVILPTRNFFTASDTVIRSSAGASEYLEIAVTDDLGYTVSLASAAGFAVAATGKTKDSVSVYSANLSRPLCLILGGEKRGISKSVLEKSNVTLCIPYPRNCNYSLSASAAANIIAFQIGSMIAPPDDSRSLADDNSLGYT